jgi:hypothetical protein
VGDAARQLRKAPGFTTTALLTMAFGIGATTAIFTPAHQVMLKSLPVAKPSELWRIGDKTRCCNWGGYTQDGDLLCSRGRRENPRSNAKSLKHSISGHARTICRRVRRRHVSPEKVGGGPIPIRFGDLAILKRLDFVPTAPAKSSRHLYEAIFRENSQKCFRASACWFHAVVLAASSVPSPTAGVITAIQLRRDRFSLD